MVSYRFHPHKGKHSVENQCRPFFQKGISAAIVAHGKHYFIALLIPVQHGNYCSYIILKIGIYGYGNIRIFHMIQACQQCILMTEVARQLQAFYPGIVLMFLFNNLPGSIFTSIIHKQQVAVRCYSYEKCRPG